MEFGLERRSAVANSGDKRRWREITCKKLRACARLDLSVEKSNIVAVVGLVKCTQYIKRNGVLVVQVGRYILLDQCRQSTTGAFVSRL